MLKSENGYVQIKGSKIGVMAEFTQLVKQLLEPNNLTLDDINLCIETAQKTEEDLDKELKKMKETLSTEDTLITEILLSMLDDLFS